MQSAWPQIRLPDVLMADGMRTAAWIGLLLLGLLVLRAVVRPLRQLRGGAASIGTIGSSVVRVGLFAVALFAASALLASLGQRTDVIGHLASGTLLLGFAVAAWLAALFVVRQFLAPPWWRLNAWDPADARTRDGVGVGAALQWIVEDVRELGRSLRPIERIALFAGLPLAMLKLAQLVGPRDALMAVYVALGVVYLSLLMALLSANRIPRTLLTRLQDLRQVARRIASGDLSARVGHSDVPEYQELGELIADINSMARTLEARARDNAVLTDQLNSALHVEQERASRDQLTQLHNHRYFQEALAAELYRCSRTGEITTIAIIDLDDFKSVNDTFGHQEGDAVLVRTANALRETLRPYDLPARIGGEEFGVIFPSTAPEEAKMVMDRILASLVSAGPNGTVQTFSGGIATFPTHAADQSSLYQLADSAAYAAKLNGKRHTVVFDPATVANVADDQRVDMRERDRQLNAAKALVQTVDSLEGFAEGHSERVGQLAAQIVRMLGYDEAFAREVYLGGLLHDVGKLGIDRAIVRKAERLTHEEFELVKRHPVLSAQIVENAGLPAIAAWIQHHHEHVDGSGYPHGLHGQEIPLAARVVLVAEAFCVMVANRPYRMALSVEQALGELQRDAGRQFDPDVVMATIQLVRSGAVELPAQPGTFQRHVA